MMTRELLSLRDAAGALDLESQRVYRLGRYLHMAPGDQCLPIEVVVQAARESDSEKRYRIVLKWLLANLRSDEASEDGHTHNGS